MRDDLQAGFRSYPWGGVETGGILLGQRCGDGIQVVGYRRVDCGFCDAVDAAWGAGGLEPVGMYHSVSHREMVLTNEDRRRLEEGFPEPGAVGLVVKGELSARGIAELCSRSWRALRMRVDA